MLQDYGDLSIFYDYFLCFTHKLIYIRYVTYTNNGFIASRIAV